MLGHRLGLLDVSSDQNASRTEQSHALTNVDSEIQHVYEQDGKEHDASLHAVRLGITTEETKKASHEFLGPCQDHE
jgi:hypothetical protein